MQDFQQPQTHLETHATLFNSSVTQPGSDRNCTHGPLSQRGLCQASSGSRANQQASQWSECALWALMALPFPMEIITEHLNPEPAQTPKAHDPFYRPPRNRCAKRSVCVLKCSALLQPKHATEATPYAEKEGTAACQSRLSSRGRTSAAFPEGFRPFPY